MNYKSTIVAGFLATSTAFLGIAHAQGSGCTTDGKPGFKRSSMQRGMPDSGARVEQRLTQLKAELKLNAQQEPLWQAFAEKSKAEAGKGIQAMRDGMKGEQPLSAPERMAQMQNIMKDRVAAMESVNESFKRLYAALTPEQKSAADKHFSFVGRHRQGPGRSGPGREGQGAPGASESRKG